MEYTSKKEQLEALVALFPPEAVKQREQGGQMLSYYNVETIRTRLNEVFAGDYEFHTKQIFFSDKNVDAVCELTLRWVDGTRTVVEECGSSDILYSKTNQGVRVNDPLKTALSDGLKRCLAFIGCGAELYNEGYRDKIKTEKTKAEQAARDKAMFTCMGCSGTIESGELGGKTYTQQEVVQLTRTKLRKRLCLKCAAPLLAGKESK